MSRARDVAAVLATAAGLLLFMLAFATLIAPMGAALAGTELPVSELIGRLWAGPGSWALWWCVALVGALAVAALVALLVARRTESRVWKDRFRRELRDAFEAQREASSDR